MFRPVVYFTVAAATLCLVFQRDGVVYLSEVRNVIVLVRLKLDIRVSEVKLSSSSSFSFFSSFLLFFSFFTSHKSIFGMKKKKKKKKSKTTRFNKKLDIGKFNIRHVLMTSVSVP